MVHRPPYWLFAVLGIIVQADSLIRAFALTVLSYWSTFSPNVCITLSTAEMWAHGWAFPCHPSIALSTTEKCYLQMHLFIYHHLATQLNGCSKRQKLCFHKGKKFCAFGCCYRFNLYFFFYYHIQGTKSSQVFFWMNEWLRLILILVYIWQQLNMSVLKVHIPAEEIAEAKLICALSLILYINFLQKHSVSFIVPYTFCERTKTQD